MVAKFDPNLLMKIKSFELLKSFCYQPLSRQDPEKEEKKHV
jgi:hypothetical protein